MACMLLACPTRPTPAPNLSLRAIHLFPTVPLSEGKREGIGRTTHSGFSKRLWFLISLSLRPVHVVLTVKIPLTSRGIIVGVYTGKLMNTIIFNNEMYTRACLLNFSYQYKYLN